MLNTSYKIKEHVVCKGKGVAEIVDIIEKDISGQVHDCYVLKFLGEDFKMFIPTQNNNSIRKPLPKIEVQGLLDFLKAKDFEVKKENWNKRSKKYSDKLRNGSTYDIADIIRELNASKSSKRLSFGERAIFDKAKELLIQELSVSEDLSEKELNLKIDECLSN